MRRIQGWDPLLIISQIISLQTIHYLLLALLAPPILEHTTNPDALAYAGGPRMTGYILDWREIASRSTAPRLPRHPPGMKRRDGGMEKRSMMDTQEPTNGTMYLSLQFEPILQNLYRREMDVPSHYAVINDNDDHYEVWDYGVSYTRGWVLAGLWIFVCLLDIIPIYYLIRKPTLVLDFACTLTFLHVVITTYYAGGLIPTTFFFWAVMIVGTVLMIIGAEQLCVRREMKEGLGNVMDPDLERLADAEAYELDDR